MRTNAPSISVIIPTFNSAEYLSETINSVFSQTYKNFEIILVDDGSTDNTPEIVSRYNNQIRYIRQENSGGPARPRNVGIAQANGKFISIFDSDDIMLPDKLQRSIDFIQSQDDLGLLFTNFVKFDEAGTFPGTFLDFYPHFRSLAKEQVGPEQFRITPAAAFNTLFYENYIGTSGVLIPKSILTAVGHFDEEVTRGGLEDRDMWFRITRKYPIGFLNYVGHRYRVRPGSVSKRVIASAEARIQVICRYLNSDMPTPTRIQANSLIAACLVSIGYQHQIQGNMPIARNYYWQSICRHPNLDACRGLLHTLLGGRMINALRRFNW